MEVKLVVIIEFFNKFIVPTVSFPDHRLLCLSDPISSNAVLLCYGIHRKHLNSSSIHWRCCYCGTTCSHHSCLSDRFLLFLY